MMHMHTMIKKYDAYQRQFVKAFNTSIWYVFTNLKCCIALASEIFDFIATPILSHMLVIEERTK